MKNDGERAIAGLLILAGIVGFLVGTWCTFGWATALMVTGGVSFGIGQLLANNS